MKKNLRILVILFAFTQIANAQNTWTQKADFGGGQRMEAVSFSIGSKGYIGTGSDAAGNTFKDVWEYDPVTNIWSQKADFGGAPRDDAFGFSIGTKGYMGGGMNQYDFWEFDPSLNVWTQKANLIAARGFTATFSVNNKGYVGTGYSNFFYKDFYEYDPASDTWTQKANFGGPKRSSAIGFSIGAKGYMGTGQPNAFNEFKDFWEYDIVTNAWTQKADCGTMVRAMAVGFSIGNKGYVGTGKGGGNELNDFWEYDPSTNTWIQKADLGGIWRYVASGFGIGNKGYIGIGNGNLGVLNDFWEYTPGCSPPSAAITTPGPTTFCTGGSVVLNGPTVTNRTYQWKKDGINIPGATSFSYTATISGNYKVTVTNTNTGCTKTTTNAIVVTVKVLPNAAITPPGPLTFCAGDSVVLQANTGAGLTYKWKKGGNYINGATLSAYTAIVGGTYKIEVTNSNGCSKTSVGVVVTVPCKKEEKLISDNQISFTIYPNPSHGEFVVAFGNSINIGIIQVYNSLDEKIFEDGIFNQSKKEIHLKNSSSGIYFLKVFDGKNQFSKKLIID